jgi:hypothetical protein
MVRPEKSTSSTRTTVFASIPDGGMRGRFGCPVGAAAQVIAVHGDVEAAGEFAAASGRPSIAAIASASRWASGTPRRGIAEEDDVLAALVGFDDLVGDAGDRPSRYRLRPALFAVSWFPFSASPDGG